MKVAPLLSVILFFIGTTFSLRAIPGDELKKSDPEGNNIAERRDSEEREATYQDTSAIDVPTGSVDGVPVIVSKSSPRYRLDQYGEWEEQHPQTQQWESTDHFARNEDDGTFKKSLVINQDNLPMHFVNQYNRADDIQKTTQAYQEELKQEQIKSSTPDSENRIFVLQHLIATLKKASDYQNAMVGHLGEQALSTDPRKAILQASDRLAWALQINESPNKIEKIADQIERIYQRLTELQIASDVVEKYIAALPPNQTTPDWLQEASKSLDEAKTHLRTAIEQSSTYAQYLQPPFEKIDQPTQTRTEEHASNFKREKRAAIDKYSLARQKIENDQSLVRELFVQFGVQAEHQAAQEAQQPQPRERVISLFTHSAEMYQQAAAANNRGSRTYFDKAGAALFQAAEEAQRSQPRERVIEWYVRSAEMYQQAVAAMAANDENDRIYFDKAGAALFQAAEEAQEPQPRERIIEWYVRLAEIRQQAVAANNENSRTYFNNAGLALFQTVKEAQQLLPRERVISLFTRSLEMYQQAVAAIAANNENSRIYFDNAGLALWNAAKEAQEPQPRERLIEWCVRSAEMFQQAEAANDAKSRTYFNNAGVFLFHTAEEAQQPQPQERVIEWYARSLGMNQQAMAAMVANDENGRIYFTNAGVFLSRAAEEAQQPQPRERVIEWYVRSAEMFQQAEAANNANSRTSLGNAGWALSQAAQEAQRPQPRQEVIDDFLRRAAEAERGAHEQSFCTIS